MKKYLYVCILCLVAGVVSAGEMSGYDHYQYDESDFAIECVDYDHNGVYNDWLSGIPMTDTSTVLGRPTVDTTGDDWIFPETMPAPVNPAYPAFRSTELLFLGEGGSVTVRFDHPVRDDVNNPYGIDLIVYGNAMQIIGGGQSWQNGNPVTFTVGGGGFVEPGIVSVSQDGITWYSYTTDSTFKSDDEHFILLPNSEEDGPFCDGFAPTMGRIIDTENPDRSLGEWNLWWDEPTNPTLPVDPTLDFADFTGKTIAQIGEAYGGGAGGTGYDLAKHPGLPIDPATGLKWIQYVRVDDQADGGSAEIDAFADVTSCGDWKHPIPDGDINGDCKVNLDDFVILTSNWLTCTWNCQ